MVSGLTGADERATIDRAVGVLIGDGNDPGQAYRILQRGAAAADLDIHGYATTVVDRARTQRWYA